ncbi:hypothetical protein ACOME3_003471 [Neoechinorhynchus agilis]
MDGFPRSVESAMMDELLSDDSVYKREDKDYTESKRKQLNRALREVIAVRNLRGMSGFTRGPLIIPVMYAMVKTHKMPFVPITTTAANLLKCRRIISASALGNSCQFANSEGSLICTKLRGTTRNSAYVYMIINKE